MGAHKDVPVGAEAAHPLGFAQSGDPGAIGAYRPWIDTSGSPWLLKIRNAADDGWETIGAILSAPVDSVFGRTGAVVAAAGDYTIADVGGITLAGEQAGDYLRFDGAGWVNSPLITGDLPAHNHAGENITSGTVAAARLATHTHAAADIASGTIAQDRLGTGSSGAGSKFLADDQTYKTVVAAASFALREENAGYLATTSDHTILVDVSGGAVEITLPPAGDAINLLLVIKKIDSSVNAVTINPDGAETIDGAATLSIPTQYQSYTIQSDGVEWWIL